MGVGLSPARSARKFLRLASGGLIRRARLARKWGAPLEKTPRFERDAHFAGAHATEWQARIGPLTPKGRHQQEDF